MRCVSRTPGFISCSVTLPFSKSILNRLLIIHHLSGGKATDSSLTDSTDTVVMQNLLLKINSAKNNFQAVTEINVGNAGTVMRFLTAVLTVTPGKWLITGTERMQLRPVKPLTDALQHCGADLIFKKNTGYPPVQIVGNPDLKGQKVQLNAGVSSQFISALMMLGPVLKGGIEIELLGDIISGSYIRMTRALMQKVGANVHFSENTVKVNEGKYKEFNFSGMNEPDWSAAAFWYQVVAFAPKAQVLLRGLKNQSVQGDSVLPEIYDNLGVKSVFTDTGLLLTKSGKSLPAAIHYDFTECPDLAQAVIVTCAALRLKGRFTGLKTLRVKETDRIAALQNELSKLGYGIQVTDNVIDLDGTLTTGTESQKPLLIKCYDDHRMAMSFATLALLRADICLDEPEVVKKSYPGFWKDLELAGFYFSDRS